MNYKNIINDTAIAKTAFFIQQQLRTEKNDSNKRVAVNDSYIYIGSSKQSVREDNQDRVVCAHISNSKAEYEIAVVAIADGMGGLEQGGLAASDTLAYFLGFISNSYWSYEPKRCVEEAAYYADSVVYKKYKRKSGSTISAIVYFNSMSVCLNIGDSRIYKIEDNTIEQISIDDNPNNLFNINNDNSADQYEMFENLDNRLTQHIGIGEGIIPHILTFEKKQDDFQEFLLTTDGLHFISKKLLNIIIGKSPSKEELTRRCLYMSDWLGGHDNATIALAPKNIDLKRIDRSLNGLTMELASSSKRFSVCIDVICNQGILPKEINAEQQARLIPREETGKEKKSGKKNKKTQKQKEPNENILTVFDIQDTSDEA